MEPIYKYLATFFGGALLMHIWNKFIHRISILRYTVFHQHIAISSDNTPFGKIEVLHNNIPVKSLYLTTITTVNDTNRDLSNIEFNLTCDTNSMILISQGFNKSSGKTVYFTERYSNLLSNNNPEFARNTLSFRDYLLPVINRGDIIEFTLIIVNDYGQFPFVTAACEHIGVKLKYQKEPRQKVFGESTSVSALIGLIIATIGCYLFIYFNFSLTAGVWFSFVLGLTATLFGTVILKIFKKLRRLFT